LVPAATSRRILRAAVDICQFDVAHRTLAFDLDDAAPTMIERLASTETRRRIRTVNNADATAPALADGRRFLADARKHADQGPYLDQRRRPLASPVLI
jgi:hypothetical protein